MKIIRELTSPAGRPVRVEESAEGIRWLVIEHADDLTMHVWRDIAVAESCEVILVSGITMKAVLRADVDDVLAGQDRWTEIDDVSSFLAVHRRITEAKKAPVRRGGFVHLHTHSEYSPLDGLSRMPEIMQQVTADDQPAVGITDHGTCAGHPELQREADKNDVQPIFGLEAYFCEEDRRERPVSGDAESQKRLKDGYFHLVLLAQNEVGLRNLWALSTESHRTGFFYRPRIDWEGLQKYSEGLICTTACLRGPLSVPILADDETLAQQRLGRLLQIFDERLYLEIHSNHLPQQNKVNNSLVALGKAHGVPLLGVVDSHYPTKSDYDLHHTWIACQTQSDVQDEGDLFANDLGLYVQTEAEVRENLSYLGSEVVDEAVGNTLVVAERCGAKIEGKKTTPTFYRQSGPSKDAAKLREMCEQNWHKVVGKEKDEEVYRARFEREFALLESKSFCGYFLMVADYCLDPSTPVLTEDMRWVEVGKLEVGDKLAGFDEHKVLKEKKSHRYWRSAEVVNAQRIVLPTYKITLEDGTETIASEDHQWLVASPCAAGIRWVRTKDLKVGQRPQRLAQEWDEPNTWEAGYIAGILDGEGSLSFSKINSGGHSLSLGFAQKEGVVLDTALRILDSWGFDYSLKDHGKARNGLRSVWIRGGRAEVMRLLGMARPQRLLAKLDMEKMGRVIAIDNPSIISIEFLGQGEVVALETTTGTLVAQGFAHHNCRWAKENGILVGPGRGSGGGSLVAYLVAITEIDPVDTDLLFERFLTEGRTSLPDFDVDFPTSKRPVVQEYLRERWGWDHTLRIGTHLRLKNKGIVGQLFSTLASQLPSEAFVDAKKVSAIINEAEAGTAGLGLSWDELWIQAGEELEPYRARYPHLFATAERLVGRLKSYGKHAAGIVISTEDPLTGRFPLRGGEDGESMISQFEMDDLEHLGLVKFDILTLRTLDTLQEAVDLIKERQGVAINPYAWGPQEYSDPAVWAELADAHTMGIFQFETTSGTKLTRRYRPDSVDDLANITAIVRPGPMRSGLTEAYLRRRAGDEPVSYPDPRLEDVLVKTYGTLIYQEDIMQTCMILAGYGSDEADAVRKILGKKKVDQVVEAGHKFVDRCVENGMDKTAASLLWDQMAEFAKYSFGKAHAYAYAMLAYWCAWLKVHFPVEFLTAAMSTVDKERVPDFIKEARRVGVEVLPPDINASGRGFRPDGSAIRYGLDAIKGVGAKAVLDIESGQPYRSFEDYLARKGKNANSGVTRLLAKVGAFDTVEPHRKALVTRLEAEHDGSASQCVFKVIGHPGPNALPCTYDWESEPRPVNKKTGKKLKQKALPKRCTKACRQYKAPEVVPIGLVGEYTETEIRQIELEMLQIELSSTAFDMMEPEDREMVRQQAELLDKGVPGMYLVVGTITKPRKIKDRNERQMAFFNLATETVEIDVACFADTFAIYGALIQPGKFVAAELRRDGRGSQLKTLSVIQD